MALSDASHNIAPTTGSEQQPKLRIKDDAGPNRPIAGWYQADAILPLSKLPLTA